MRFLNILIPVICALSLSACSGTWEGMRSDVSTAENSVTTEKNETSAGSGIVLKPSALAQQAPAVPPPEAAPVGDSLNWRQLDNYDPGHFPRDNAVLPADDLAPVTSASIMPSLPGGEDYNQDVEVFPLDGDVPADPVYAAAAPAYVRYGSLRQQIFFSHASAAVRSADAKKLHVLAGRVKSENLAVTVVGHASRRVDRVKDPLKKKMINFAMAQKRANAVTHVLKKAGLKPAWVQAVSKGDEEPNPDPGLMHQEAADRRAEVYMDER